MLSLCIICNFLVVIHCLFSKTYFRNTIRVSNHLDRDQEDRMSHLCHNCLQRLLADEKKFLLGGEISNQLSYHIGPVKHKMSA